MKAEKLELQEPDFTEDKLLQIIELEQRAKNEHTKTREEYWQGRKDALRIVLSILQPDEKIWNLLIKSSDGFQVEEYIAVKEFMKDARYNIADILFSIQNKERPRFQTRINLIQWLDQYDRMSKKGTTLEVNDAVDCGSNFQWSMK